MNARRSSRVILYAVLFLFALSACARATPVIPNTGGLYTQAAQTVVSRLTQSAGSTAVALLTQQAAGPAPGQPQEKTPQANPPSTDAPPTATSTPVPPTNTPVPPTPTPRPCDWASFVGDVSIKDGTVLQPGEEFVKTWRLKNIGTCTWNNEYELVFSSGEQMNGPKSISLDGNVKPGEVVDVSVDLVAPEDEGEYLGRWILRNADGGKFGLGADQETAFWVSINVVRPVEMVWDMVKDACLGTWSTGSLEGLACPDLNQPMDIGFINIHPKPVLETGKADDEPALVTFPSQGEDGYINGVYPPFKVKDGDSFRAVIGCLNGSDACKVTFQLNYRIGNGPVKNLGSWKQVYDEKVRKLEVDLSSLRGKEVQFILTVLNNGDSTDDWAFWLLPSIWR